MGGKRERDEEVRGREDKKRGRGEKRRRIGKAGMGNLYLKISLLEK